MTRPLMPIATAVWLIDNTSVTFDQVAEFCELHPLEVEGIANGDVAIGIKGFDPIANGQLLQTEIERCQNDETAELVMAEKKHEIPEVVRRKGPRYTPVSRRRDRPNAIAWLLRNHAELSDGQIGKLIGTTKSTINAVRNRSHWNASSIKPVDPVSLGLCSQIELDGLIAHTAGKAERKAKKQARLAQRLLKEADGAAGSEGASQSDPIAETAREMKDENMVEETGDTIMDGTIEKHGKT